MNFMITIAIYLIIIIYTLPDFVLHQRTVENIKYHNKFKIIRFAVNKITKVIVIWVMFFSQ